MIVSRALVVLGLAVAALPATAQGTDVPPAERMRIAHALSRLTFGPRPGDVDRVAQIGLDRWIDQQLHPESIADTALKRTLAGCDSWTDPVGAVAISLSGVQTFSGPSPNGGSTMRVVVTIPTLRFVTRDSARRVGIGGEAALDNGQLFACRYTRVETSDQQLLEVMTEFWENHFSVWGYKVLSRGSIVEWDRAVIRPNAFGRFRDLLGAVAHSPVMLNYLDNALSAADTMHATLRELTMMRGGRDSLVLTRRKGGINENYARELLELHTLGVDGGYTQRDVGEVARAFTGWTHTLKHDGNGFTIPRAGIAAAFMFDSATHDAEPKVVLGHELRGGRGLEDGEEILDIVARHPATAHHIARKLTVRFVSDMPPEALVERAAAEYLRTDGDIRAVMRMIVTSPEFFASQGAKVKSPVELVLGTRRLLSAPVDTAAEMMDLFVMLEQTPFGRQSPEGWPDVGATWMSASAMRTRMWIADQIASGSLASIPIERWPSWAELANAPFDRQLNGVIHDILGDRASEGTRSALSAVKKRVPGGQAASLRELVAVALSSPDFQRR